MPSWEEVEREAPDLARDARRFLDAHTHKTLATLRLDGSPRISGTEVQFDGGDLLLGTMWRSMKALDLLRDPRFALHSGSDDPPGWDGDAKLAGRAEETADEARKEAIRDSDTSPGPFHLFRADITELVVVRIGEPRDHIVIESWHECRGVARRERR